MATEPDAAKPVEPVEPDVAPVEPDVATAGAPEIGVGLVLASASPRRLDLLRQIGIVPHMVDAANIDERVRPRELPGPHARRLAEEKARVVAARHPGHFILAADTVVACGRRILPKAESVDQARQCLALLSGRRHRVYGGFAVVTPQGRLESRLVVTAVLFRRLSESEQLAYIASGEWHGKAGGYAIQGRAAALIPWVNGSYSNIVGLPLAEVAGLLQGLGYRLP